VSHITSASPEAGRSEAALTSRRVVAAAALCGLLLGGCTSDTEPRSTSESEAPVVQLGAPGEDSRTLTPEEQESLDDAPGHTPDDVAFVRGMIAHHRQALRMTAMVERRADDPRIPVFAERLEVSQRDEITQLQDWLEQRGEGGAGHGGHEAHQHQRMPGMLTRAELARLQRARGERFDRLFLLFMIRHHEGAIMMVDDLLRAGVGGQEPAVFQIAQHVDSDQRVEIARMKRLLRD